MFKSRPVSERQKWVTTKNLCNVCFRKAHTNLSQCPLMEVVKRLNQKVCDVDGCGLPHSFLLHPDQRKASANIFTVLEEEDDDMDEEDPASEDEEEDDQSPRARLLRGILQAGRPVQDDQPPEDDSEEPAEAVKEPEAVLEDEEKLEPEKEKNPPSHAEEEYLDYRSMEAIAKRWRSKPKRVEAASNTPEAKSEVGVKPLASVPGTKGKKHPTLLLAELLRVEGEMAVVQHDMGATALLVTSSFINMLNLFSRPERVQVSITSGIDGGPEEATLSHELYIKYLRGSAYAARFLEVEKIRRLPQPPQEEVLDEIFPNPDREEWVADWGLT